LSLKLLRECRTADAVVDGLGSGVASLGGHVPVAGGGPSPGCLSRPAAGRAARTREVIRRHAARAAIGALTALAPAEQLGVSGPVAAGMSEELARLRGADASPEVLESLLLQAQRQIDVAAPLFLAVAAGVLARSPVASGRDAGLLRAVALGLSFEALGKAVAEDLDRCGVLRPAGAPALLRTTSAADLAPLAPRYARLVQMALQRAARSSRGGVA
jgi:hypothetical protein